MFAVSISENGLGFRSFVMAESVQLAKMVGVMHVEDHAYSIWSIW